MANLDFHAKAESRFERRLGLMAPEGVPFCARNLGYGEMSTVLNPRVAAVRAAGCGFSTVFPVSGSEALSRFEDALKSFS